MSVMDKAELLEFLSPILAEYTLCDVDVEHPLKETMRKNNNGRWTETAHSYDIKRDKFVASAFKPIVGDNERQRSYYRMASIVIVSILCRYSLSSATHDQLANLIQLSAYDAKAMNQFANELRSEEISCFGRRKLAPLGVLLFRTLWDCLCEDGKVLTTEQKKRRKGTRREKGDNSSFYRPILLQITDYLHCNHLLDFFSLCPYTKDEFACFIDKTLDGEDVSHRREDAVNAYDEAIRKVAVMECKKSIFFGELSEMRKARDAEQGRIDLEFYRRVDKQIQEHENKLNASKSSKSFNILPADAPFSIEQFQFSDFALSHGKSSKLESKQLPPYMAEIANEFSARIDCLADYCEAVQDNAEAEYTRIMDQEAEFLKTDDYVDIGESAFLAILMGDPFYKTKIGHSLFILLSHAGCIPAVSLCSPELEDEGDWDTWVYPGDNGRLESTVISDADVAFYNPERTQQIKVPLKIGSVLAEYAECQIELPLTFRKSYVKAYKSLGLSDRKARDLAIITSTLVAAHKLDPEDKQGILYYPEETPTQSTVRKPAAEITSDDAVRAAQSERDEAVHLRKAAERESQMLRHEMAKLRRTLESTEAELVRSNTLLELYESIRPEEESVDTVSEAEEQFPYYTKLKVVLYGGFPSFNQDIQALIPSIRIMPSAAHLDVNLVRNADIVFIQLNHTSHSNYWNVRDTASASGVPYYHLNYAGPRRCAGIMVKEIKRIEDTNTPL